MRSRSAIAAQVAQNKAEHPDKFCPVKRCLWRTGNGEKCPRHRPKSNVMMRMDRPGNEQFDKEKS